MRAANAAIRRVDNGSGFIMEYRLFILVADPLSEDSFSPVRAKDNKLGRNLSTYSIL